MMTMGGGGGAKKSPKFDDLIVEWPLKVFEIYLKMGTKR
jgi:hypothetical protein